MHEKSGWNLEIPAAFFIFAANWIVIGLCFRNLKSKKTNGRSLYVLQAATRRVQVTFVVFFDLLDTPSGRWVKCAHKKRGRRKKRGRSSSENFILTRQSSGDRTGLRRVS